MKKKLWIPIVIIVFLAILFVPIPTGTCRDGGTSVYSALTYKIINWNRITDDTTYSKTRVYFFPDNFKSIDELWDSEGVNIENIDDNSNQQNNNENAEQTFIATVLEIYDSSVVVQPVGCSDLLSSREKVSFGTSKLEKIDIEVGSVVKITFDGKVMESFPVQITASSWEISNDLSHLKYTGQWLDKTTAEKAEDYQFEHIKITKIYFDCFFAEPVIPMPYEIKLNGSISGQWCIGDQVSCTYENTYLDEETFRIEADMLTIKASDFQPEPNVAYKPVIYLYPERETDVSVNLNLNGELTCTYPAYGNGWKVTASPDGTLTDAKGQTYNYIYWEGKTNIQYDFSKGFCVKGEDTATFLEVALEKLGLTRREANEFIVFWLPMMEQNPYNVISFQTDIYTDAAKLDIAPAPDTLIRVFMAWQKADAIVEIPEQELSAPERKGFTVVEWGGTEILK